MAISTINDAEQLSVVRTKINDNFSSIGSDLASIDGRLNDLEVPAKAYALIDMRGDTLEPLASYTCLATSVVTNRGSSLFDVADVGGGVFGIRYNGVLTKTFIVEAVVYSELCGASSANLLLYSGDIVKGLEGSGLPVISYPVLSEGLHLFLHYSTVVTMDTNSLVALFAKCDKGTIDNPIVSYTIREV